MRPTVLQFDRITLPEETEALRVEVRQFLQDNAEHLSRPNSDFTTGHDPAFSRKLGQRGWIGMTWPKRYGGGERSFFDRYVVTEELLAAGAPVSAHWIADRQSGNLILSVGSEAQRERYLPPIARGESYFSIGMSEPNSGSDLASVRTRAERVEGGWLINGTKLWSTDAHRNHFMIALVRTEPPSDNRHAGLSQIIIDLREDGAVIRPIRNMAGGEDFNEVVFEDVLVPEDRVVGEPGNGWQQVTGELAYERSGPERFLSAFRVFVELVRVAAERGDPALRLPSAGSPPTSPRSGACPFPWPGCSNRARARRLKRRWSRRWETISRSCCRRSRASRPTTPSRRCPGSTVSGRRWRTRCCCRPLSRFVAAPGKSSAA